MEKYLEVSIDVLEKVDHRIIQWYYIRPIETDDNRHVIPKKVLQDLEQNILSKVDHFITKHRLTQLIKYLHTVPEINEEDIVWKTF